MGNNFDSQGWYAPAQQHNYLNKSMSRYGHTITHLVIHGTAGGNSAQGIANYFATSSTDASAHFIVDQQGVVVQGVNCLLASWSNGALVNPTIPYNPQINPNYYCISIECVKASADNSDTLTEAQEKALYPLINDICNEYKIKKIAGDANGGIVPHSSFDSVNRARCPGAFNWQKMFDYLKGGNNMNIPANWNYDANTKILTAPNGIVITDGFCQFILNNKWDDIDIPLMPAFGLNTVEVGNPGLGSGTVQPFRTKVLAWTPKTGVYVMWLGQEYISLYRTINQTNQALANAVAEIVVLKKQIGTKSTNVSNVAAIEQLHGIVAQLNQLKEDAQNNIMKLSSSDNVNTQV